MSRHARCSSLVVSYKDTVPCHARQSAGPNTTGGGGLARLDNMQERSVYAYNSHTVQYDRGTPFHQGVRAFCKYLSTPSRKHPIDCWDFSLAMLFLSKLISRARRGVSVMTKTVAPANEDQEGVEIVDATSNSWIGWRGL